MGVTQFITADGTDTGELVEIRRKYVQNGNVIENSVMNIDGFEQYDSITEDFCQNYKVAFNDYDDHTIKGGLKVMGESLARGHVLVMSLWDDHEANMLWLDSNYPQTATPRCPAVPEAPAPRTLAFPARSRVSRLKPLSTSATSSSVASTAHTRRRINLIKLVINRENKNAKYSLITPK